MNHEAAAKIVAEIAPKLVVDPFNPRLPDMLVLRTSKGAHPFSMHLTSINPATLTAIGGQDATPEIEEELADDGHTVVVPYQPARPAVVAQTVAEIQTEMERRVLVEQITQAQALLG